jgi:xanthine/uracil permease
MVGIPLRIRMYALEYLASVCLGCVIGLVMRQVVPPCVHGLIICLFMLQLYRYASSDDNEVADEVDDEDNDGADEYIVADIDYISAWGRE